MSIFGDRLKLVRINNGLMQKDMSAILGVTTLAYQRYEYGDREPNLDKIIKLCNHFDISSDYLLGLSDNPKRH